MKERSWTQKEAAQMPTIYLTTGDALAIITPQLDGQYEADLQLRGLHTYCLDADPLNPSVLYCGTFGQGLWLSRDAGHSWQAAGDGIAYPEVMAVAVSRSERVNGHGVAWAGTEPSAIFRSEDGGLTWRECPSLRVL